MRQNVNPTRRIAERLRALADGHGGMSVSEFRDAAAEIERLTEALEAAQAALKEYGDEMVELRAEIERGRGRI